MSLPTEQHFILKEDGKIYWIEKMPEHPVKSFEAAHYISAEMEYECAVLEYNEALKSAIDSAVEVANQAEVAAVIVKAYNLHVDFPLNNGFVYSLLCSVEKKVIETKETCLDLEFTGGKTVALVTFSQPEKETQEEWIFKLRDYEVYFGDWYGLPGTSYVKLTRKEK